jgi:hypothetical protein
MRGPKVTGVISQAVQIDGSGAQSWQSYASAPARQLRTACGQGHGVFGLAAASSGSHVNLVRTSATADQLFSANDSAASQRPERCSPISVTARVIAVIGKYR